MDTPAPPAVIPAAKRIYTEAAATLALDGATHVYLQRGVVGPPLGDNYAGPYLVLEKGPKVFKLQVRTREDVVTRDRLKPHVGLAPPAVADPLRRGRPPGRRLDLPQDFRRSAGSSVTALKSPERLSYYLSVKHFDKNLRDFFAC